MDNFFRMVTSSPNNTFFEYTFESYICSEYTITLYDLVEDYEVTAKDAALASLPSTS